MNDQRTEKKAVLTSFLDDAKLTRRAFVKGAATGGAAIALGGVTS
ncbi:MAG: twin-arginine translocation signal domain-containing protein [Deltaproteobacteria bacterium]|nr:twin-arginine translocation signal domain-containing protein [Deltaproteobacteria bacterium]